MRAILSSGMALSALAGATPVWGQTGDMPADLPEPRNGNGRADSRALPVPRLGLGPVWDLADQASAREAILAGPGHKAGHPADAAATYRLRLGSGDTRLISVAIGDAPGAVRFRYRGGYTRGRPRADLADAGCVSPRPARDVAGRCGIPVERTSRIHQGGLERNWQGLAESVWNLGAENTLVVGGSISKARRFHDETQGVFTGNAPAFTQSTAGPPRDTGLALSSGMIGAFRQKEKVTAAFASTRLALPGGMTLTPGLRYERTRQRLTGFRADDGTLGAAMPQRRIHAAMLPSVILTADPSPHSELRLRWSRDVSRAELLALSPGAIVEGHNAQVWLGNPDLRPSLTDSFDLTGLWSPVEGGSISTTLFARLADNPIIASSESRGSDQLTTTRAINALHGRDSGIETRYTQSLTFLPGAFSHLGLELVAGYARAHVTTRVTGAEGTTPSSTQSRTRYGATVSWQRGPVESSISWNRTGTALLTVGDRGAKPGPQHRIDARTRMAVSRNCSIFLEAQNLTDAPTLQFQDSLRHWTIENERYGRTVLIGAWARF